MHTEFKKYATKHLGISSTTLDGFATYSSKNMRNYGNIYSNGYTATNAAGYTSPNITSYLSPTIIEERQLNIAQMDVFSRLMMDRIIFLGVPIDDQVANIIQAQLLFLDSVDSRKGIQIYLNTPGGSVYAGLGIYDTMQYINSEIATICTGMAASMGAILLCAGAKSKRTALKHSRVLIHQPLGGAQGQASDIEITTREILKIKQELYEIISLHTGKEYEQIYKDADRDYWMTSKEALEYGMVDEILEKSK